MADYSDSNNTDLEDNAADDNTDLKKSLEVWREFLIPLNNLLTWKLPIYPAIIAGVTSFIFILILFYQLSVLTTVCLLGLVITCLDFAVPILGPQMSAGKPWTNRDQEEYEHICDNISYICQQINGFVDSLIYLKTEKPKMYFCLVNFGLICCAYIGHIINNLFLTYIIVLLILLMPGLVSNGILQRYYHKYRQLVQRNLLGHMPDKKKRN